MKTTGETFGAVRRAAKTRAAGGLASPAGCPGVSPIDTALSKLEGVKRVSGGRFAKDGYMARCPAHDDRTASLSLSEGDDGRALLCCHAGCTVEAITAALGMTPADLFADKGDGKREIVATYDYTDESGKPLFQVVRFAGKDFRQRRIDGTGGWVWNLKGVERVLYRLPEVLEAVEATAIVYIVEGEKDADRLHDLGLVATTNPGGAGKWRPEYCENLRGAHVVIIADKDEPGRKHAFDVAAKLAGIAADLRIVEAAVGKDASDHLAAGKALEDLVEVSTAAAPDVSIPPGDTATAQPRVAELREWAIQVSAMSPLNRQVSIENMRKTLTGTVASPMKFITAALQEASATDKDAPAGLLLADVGPWDDEVDGAELLDDLATTYQRFVALPEAGAEALALYTLLTFTPDCFFIMPILAVLSPVKRSGKTTALAVAGAVVSRPLPASNITTAALFRSVDRHHPTLIVDEADSFLHENEEMRGLLNAGHTRATCFVIRTVGDDHEPQQFSVWCPKIVAGIGKLAATLEDRSIIIQARRRAPGEHVERLRLDRLSELEHLRRKCRRWADDHIVVLGIADPVVPALASDRAADNWRPLLAIADAAGGEWPGRARWAAIVLGGSDESDGASVQMLSDLRDLFASRQTDRLSSDAVIHALGAMEERPWPEWYHGKPISVRQVAKLLHPFGVKPKVMRIDGHTPRGYEASDFTDAWTRYLSPLPPCGSATSATSLQNGTFSCATPEKPVADEKPAICRDVSDIADETPPPERLPL